jgi:hypothetical protein
MPNKSHSLKIRIDGMDNLRLMVLSDLLGVSMAEIGRQAIFRMWVQAQQDHPGLREDALSDPDSPYCTGEGDSVNG